MCHNFKKYNTWKNSNLETLTKYANVFYYSFKVSEANALLEFINTVNTSKKKKGWLIMKFKNIDTIIDVFCDCGYEDLQKLSYEDVVEMKCIKSIKFNQGYKCGSCGTLVTVPFHWLEV